jgi:hypothetical protein
MESAEVLAGLFRIGTEFPTARCHEPKKCATQSQRRAMIALFLEDAAAILGACAMTTKGDLPLAVYLARGDAEAMAETRNAAVSSYL